ncbi:MAG: helix-turn-helix domain-containing protein [Niastella sp.]|nr:helix-turn-helix domain-containing protein [Niastella sp.]
MRSLDTKQPAFFSIHNLTEVTAISACDTNDDIIEVYLVLDGAVTIRRIEYETLLENNTLYCARWNKQDSMTIEPGTVGYLIRFEKALLYSNEHELYSSHFPDFLTLVLRGEVLPVDAAFIDSGTKLCEMMRQEFKDQSDFNRQMLIGFLNIFLLRIIRKLNASVGQAGHGPKYALVHKFNVLLEQKFKTNKKVADYAALLFVTPNYLNEIIKHATGNSAGFHIRQRVALEAVRQAKLTGASMKEVAGRLGFNDNAHFSKFFKKVAGRNFSELKKIDIN